MAFRQFVLLVFDTVNLDIRGALAILLLKIFLDEGTLMLSYAVLFFILALIAGFLGFSGAAGTLAGLAEIFFYVFVVLLVVSAVVNALRGRPPL